MGFFTRVKVKSRQGELNLCLNSLTTENHANCTHEKLLGNRTRNSLLFAANRILVNFLQLPTITLAAIKNHEKFLGNRIRIFLGKRPRNFMSNIICAYKIDAL